MKHILLVVLCIAMGTHAQLSAQPSVAGAMNLDFAGAFLELKAGEHIARRSWRPFCEVFAVTIEKPTEGFPELIVGNTYLFNVVPPLMPALPWVPTQAELFADDWYVIEKGD